MVHFSIQDILFPGETLEERFERASAYGFDAVEVFVRPEVDPDVLLIELQRSARICDCRVAALCTGGDLDPLQPHAADRAVRLARLADLLQVCEEMGAAGVVSVPLRPGMGHHADVPWADAHQMLADELVDLLDAWVSTLSQDGSASLILEPLNRYEAQFLTQLGQAVAIAERVDSPRVKALADTFHMNIEENDLVDAIRNAGNAVAHVHVADNTRLLPGTGTFDFRTFFSALQAIDYTGSVSIECWPPAGRPVWTEASRELVATGRFLRDEWASARDRSDDDR